MVSVGLGFPNTLILEMSLLQIGRLSVKWTKKCSISSGACPCKMFNKCLLQLQSRDDILYLGAERAELGHAIDG